jgi:hypothetical protein
VVDTRAHGDEVRDAWAETLATPGAIYVVAEVDGERAAYALLLPIDDAAMELAVFATVPSQRRRGSGVRCSRPRWAERTSVVFAGS